MAKITESCRCSAKFELEYNQANDLGRQSVGELHAAFIARHEACRAPEPSMRSGGHATTQLGPVAGEVPSAAWTRTPPILGFRPNQER